MKMTAMPQLVALFNGVGGGAAALVACSSIRHGFATSGGALPLDRRSPIVLSVRSSARSPSAGLDDRLRQAAGADHRPPDRLPAADRQRAARSIVVVGLAVFVASPNRRRAVPVHRRSCSPRLVLGVLFVLPIGGADMPVVISLLNAFTGLAAAAPGSRSTTTSLIVAGTLVGASGTILTLLMAQAMNRSIGNIALRRLRGGAAAAGGDAARRAAGRSISAEDVGDQLAYATRS